MLAVVLVAGAALGIVVFAIRIVIGWISPKAGFRFDRAVRFASALFVKLVIVVVACGILAAVWATFRPI